METDNISERSERERLAHNEGLQRTGYYSFFKHTRYHYIHRQQRLQKEFFQCANGKQVLELGTNSWSGLLERNEIKPASLYGINISENELELGIQKAETTFLSPRFLLMDANRLAFKDNTFDVVFGGGILHHLDCISALDEVCRVLKPRGKIFFIEPLAINPIAKLVRCLTPRARTVDEQPLRFRDLKAIKNRFHAQFYYEELLSVPFGVLSKLLFKDPANWLMSLVFTIDLALDRWIPPLRYMYRHVVITGSKK